MVSCEIGLGSADVRSDLLVGFIGSSTEMELSPRISDDYHIFPMG